MHLNILTVILKVICTVSFQNFVEHRKRPPLCFIKLNFLHLVLPFYTVSSCIYDSSNSLNSFLQGRGCLWSQWERVCCHSQYRYLTSTFTRYTGKRENKPQSTIKNIERLYTVHQDHTFMDLDSEDRKGEYHLVKRLSPLLQEHEHYQNIVGKDSKSISFRSKIRCIEQA